MGDAFAVIRLRLLADLTRINDAGAKVAGILRGQGPALDKLGRTLSRKVTAPLLAIGAAATFAFSRFDEAMTNSLSIMRGVSEVGLPAMEKAAEDVARTTTISATKAAEAYFFLASAGFDAEQSIAALPRVAVFAQAGMFDMATATDLATDAQSALGLKSKDSAENLKGLTRVTDVFAKANELANATIQQFAEAMTNRAGPALRQVNKSIEEGTAILAVYADQGVKGQRAGQQLAIVLTNLKSKALENAEAFRQHGVAVFDAEGKMRNMADITADLEMATAGMSDEQKQATLALLGFTDRAQIGLDMLIGNSEAIRQYQKDLESAGGTVDRIASIQMQSFAASMALVRNRVDLAAQSLGKAMAPALQSVAQWIGRVADWFSALSPRMQQAIAIFGAVVAAIGPLLIVLAKIIMIAPAIGAAATVMFGPWGLVIAAAVAAVAVLTKALTASEGPWKDLGDIIREVAGIVGTVFVGALKDVGASIRSVVSDLGDIASIIGQVLGPITSLTGAINLQDSKLLAFVAKWNALTIPWKVAAAALGLLRDAYVGVATVMGIATGATDKATKAGQRYADTVDNIIDELEAEAKAEKDAASEKDALAAAAAAATTALEDQGEAVKKIASVMDDWRGDIRGVAEDFKRSGRTIADAMEATEATIEATTDRLRDLAEVGQTDNAVYEKLEKTLAAMETRLLQQTRALAELKGVGAEARAEAEKLGQQWLITTSILEEDIDLPDIVQEDKWATAFDKIDGFFKKLFNDTNFGFQEVLQNVGANLSGMAGLFQQALGASGGVGKALAVGLGFFKSFGLDIEGIFSKVFDFIDQGFKNIFSGIGQILGFGSVSDPIGGIIDDAMKALRGGFEEIRRQAGFLGDDFDSTATLISQLRNTLMDLDRQGISPTDPAVQKLTETLQGLESGAITASEAMATLTHAVGLVMGFDVGGLLEDIAALNFQGFGDIDDVGEALAAINDKINAEVERMRRIAEALGEPFDEAAVRVDLLAGAITDLITEGEVSQEVIDALAEALRGWKEEAQEATDEFGEMGGTFIHMAEELTETFRVMLEPFKVLRDRFAETSISIAATAVALGLIGEPFNVFQAQAQNIRQHILALINDGMDPMSDEMQQLVKDFQAATDAAREYERAMRPEPAELVALAMQALAEELELAELRATRYKDSTKSLNEQITLIEAAMRTISEIAGPEADAAFQALAMRLAELRDALMAAESAAADTADALDDIEDSAPGGDGTPDDRPPSGGRVEVKVNFPDTIDVTFSARMRSAIESISLNTSRLVAAMVLPGGFFSGSLQDRLDQLTSEMAAAAAGNTILGEELLGTGSGLLPDGQTIIMEMPDGTAFAQWLAPNLEALWRIQGILP